MSLFLLESIQVLTNFQAWACRGKAVGMAFWACPSLREWMSSLICTKFNSSSSVYVFRVLYLTKMCHACDRSCAWTVELLLINHYSSYSGPLTHLVLPWTCEMTDWSWNLKCWHSCWMGRGSNVAPDRPSQVLLQNSHWYVRTYEVWSSHSVTVRAIDSSGLRYMKGGLGDRSSTTSQSPRPSPSYLSIQPSSSPHQPYPQTSLISCQAIFSYPSVNRSGTWHPQKSGNPSTLWRSIIKKGKTSPTTRPIHQWRDVE